MWSWIRYPLGSLAPFGTTGGCGGEGAASIESSTFVILPESHRSLADRLGDLVSGERHRLTSAPVASAVSEQTFAVSSSSAASDE
jgi:hypothetical protein